MSKMKRGSSILVVRFVIVTSTILSLIISQSYASSLTAECQFEDHYATYINEDKTEKYEKGPTYITIIDEDTTDETMNIRDILG